MWERRRWLGHIQFVGEQVSEEEWDSQLDGEQWEKVVGPNRKMIQEYGWAN